MAAPTFVNAGAVAIQGFGTSIAPSLPASLVNGNLLIACVFTHTFDKAMTWPAGWTQIGLHNDTGDYSVEYRARIVDGSEGATISVTWTGNVAARAKIWQFTGNVNDVDAAIGATAEASAVSASSTITNPGLTSTADNSLAVLFAAMKSGVQVTGTPTGYTIVSDEDYIGAWSETLATAGNSSDAVSQAIESSQLWHTHSFEIMSETPGVTGSGVVVSDAAAADGTGVSESTGSGALVADDSTVSGSAGVIGAGTPTASASSAAGAGTVETIVVIPPPVAVIVINR